MWVGDRAVGGRRGVGEGAAVGTTTVGCDDAADRCSFPPKVLQVLEVLEGSAFPVEHLEHIEHLEHL